MGWQPGDAETSQSRRRVHPRAAGPQGRVCYLIPESGYMVGGGGGCCPSRWLGVGARGKGESPQPPLAPSAFHILPQTYIKTVRNGVQTCHLLWHMQSRACDRHGEEWVSEEAGKAQAYRPWETSFPNTEKSSSNFWEKFLKISLHWLSNMMVLSDAGSSQLN